MRLDLVFPLIDVLGSEGRDWYQQSARMMLETARHAFAGHDIRFVQMTDAKSEIAEGVNIRFMPTMKCEKAELAQYRGHCTAEWALQTDRPAIFCDVDVLWNNDGVTQLFDGSAMPAQRVPDITLFTRPNLFQPFNGGLILTQPNQTKFWEAYREMMRVLPIDIRTWWGDQIALSAMCGAPEMGQNGARRFGSVVAYIPIDLVAPSPKTEPMQLLQTSAVHWKGGKRKPWMMNYLTMLQQSWSARAAAE